MHGIERFVYREIVTLVAMFSVLMKTTNTNVVNECDNRHSYRDSYDDEEKRR